MEYFERTSDILKASWAGRADEVWLIIAVTKCDLDWPHIAQVQEYYVPGDNPGLDGAFAKRLRLLMEQLKFPSLPRCPLAASRIRSISVARSGLDPGS